METLTETGIPTAGWRVIDSTCDLGVEVSAISVTVSLESRDVMVQSERRCIREGVSQTDRTNTSAIKRTLRATFIILMWAILESLSIRCMILIHLT